MNDYLIKFSKSLNYHSGHFSIISNSIYVDSPKKILDYKICFNFTNKTIFISDLYTNIKWTKIKDNFTEKDVQPTIDFYYNYYNKLQKLKSFI